MEGNVFDLPFSKFKNRDYYRTSNFLQSIKSLIVIIHYLKVILLPLVCLAWVSIVSSLVLGASYFSPILLASMGAAAVIMFSAPQSPMATFRAFILGNILSAIVGVSCFQLMGGGMLTGPVAVGLAIGLMHICKCAHPPGGATALVAVIGGEQIHALGYQYVLTPVGINVLLFAGIVYLHRRHLSAQASHLLTTQKLQTIFGDTETTYANNPQQLLEIREAIQHHKFELEVTPDQIQKILSTLDQRGRRKNFTTGNCSDHMITGQTNIDYGESLHAAWQLMQETKRENLIVTFKNMEVAGQLRLSTLLKMIDIKSDKDLVKQINSFFTPSGELETKRPEEVGPLTEPIVSVFADEPSSTLIDGADQTYAVVDKKKKFLGAIDLS